MMATANVSAVRDHTLIPFPYDAPSACAIENWRSSLVWPLKYAEARDTSRAVTTTLLRAIARMDEESGLVFGAASSVYVVFLLAIVETAISLERSEGRNFTTTIPEVGMILGLQDIAQHDGSAIDLSFKMHVNTPNRPLARAMVWTAGWTPWWRLPGTFLSPEFTVFNHNPLLAKDARNSGRRLRYKNCEVIFNTAMEAMPDSAPVEELSAAANRLFTEVLQEVPVSEIMRERLVNILTAKSTHILAATHRQMRALARLPALPEHVWAGSGGYWTSRLVGMEVMRRGGTVRRFDHGGNRVLSKDLQPTTIVEASAATHVVMYSQRSAQRWMKESVSQLLPKGRRVVFEAPQSSPAPIETAEPPGNIGKTPRVMYASGLIRGFRQVIPASLPDLVYLDFQLRFAEFLSCLPVDLVLRPHPDGLFGVASHPLNAVKKVSEVSFEKHLESCDVVIIDSPYSRVFCKALCSNRRLVFLDPGYDYFCDDVMSLVRRRCRFVPLTQDERGRFHFDPEEIRSAIYEVPAPDPDVIYELRVLFGGHL